MISARGVSVVWRGASILDDVSIRVQAGECVGVSGAHGGGTSTLLQVLAGMVKPTRGSIHLNDEQRPADAIALRRNVSYASSEATVGCGLRVDEYLRFVTQVRSPRAEIGTPFYLAAARRAGLDPSTPITTLSPPQCAALAIVTAVVTPVSVVLIDQALDVMAGTERDRVISWLAEIRDRGVAMILASHDDDVQKALCHRVLRLVRGAVTEERSSHASPPVTTSPQAGSMARAR